MSETNAAVPPVVPVVPANTKVDSSVTKSAVPDIKAANSTVDKVAADKVKTESAAEKAVIQKIKVGDMEYDETTLKSMIEKSKGADKKFLEAAQTRKEAIKFFKMATENPREFLKQTGLDPKKFAYDEVAEDIKNKLRDPREVELEEAKERLKKFEAQEADRKRVTDEELLSKRAKAIEQKMHAEAIEALEAFPQLPKNAWTVAKLAEAVDMVRTKTGELLTFKEVAPIVVNDIRGMVKGIVTGADAEAIIDLIGEEGMSAIRKYDIAKLKNPLKNSDGTPSNSASSEKPKQKRWKNSHDYWKSIDDAAKAERGE